MAIMPSFRDPQGNWSWGRTFGNALDAIAPYDIYNSQTGHWNRGNATASAVSSINPLAGAATHAYVNWNRPGSLGSFVRGVGGAANTGANFVRGMFGGGVATMPDFQTQFGRDLNNISAGYLNRGVGSPGMFDNARADIESRIANQPTRPAGSAVARPQGGSVGSYGSGRVLGDHSGRGDDGVATLGAGMLGLGGLMDMIALDAAIRSRNGTQIER